MNHVTSQVLALLEGTWTGDGRGEFPGVISFDYRETLTFTRRDEKTLAYEQCFCEFHNGYIDVISRSTFWERYDQFQAGQIAVETVRHNRYSGKPVL